MASMLASIFPRLRYSSIGAECRPSVRLSAFATLQRRWSLEEGRERRSLRRRLRPVLRSCSRRLTGLSVALDLGTGNFGVDYAFDLQPQQSVRKDTRGVIGSLLTAKQPIGKSGALVLGIL